jgi:hypothetical protein
LDANVIDEHGGKVAGGERARTFAEDRGFANPATGAQAEHEGKSTEEMSDRPTRADCFPAPDFALRTLNSGQFGILFFRVSAGLDGRVRRFVCSLCFVRWLKRRLRWRRLAAPDVDDAAEEVLPSDHESVQSAALSVHFPARNAYISRASARLASIISR